MRSMPLEVPGQALFADLEAIAALRRYYDWKLDLIRPFLGPRIMEIGCGTGLILDRLRGYERVMGVDINARCLARAADRVRGRPEVVLRHLNAQDPDFPERVRAPYSTVLFMNSLEIIADDAAALRNAAAVLEPGGRVVVYAWALETPAGPLLRETYGLRHYRAPALMARLTEAGFTDVRARYVNLLGVLSWLVRRRGLEDRIMTPAEYRLHDLFTPLARLLDWLTGPPFGRVVLATGRKT